MPARSDDPWIEVYVRSLAPRGATARLEKLFDRLETLVDADAIEGYAIQVWGAAVAHGLPGVTQPGDSSVNHRLVTLHQWASRNDFELEPLYRTYRRSTIGDGQRRWVTELPTAALVEFRSNDIAFTSPCIKEGRTYTVEQHLNALDVASGEPLLAREQAVPIRDSWRGTRGPP